MKYSAALFAAVFGATQVNAECVEGHREVISPGYTVEYKCGLVRAGEVHQNIASDKACAELCRDASRSVCTYHAPTRRCVTGTEGGKESARTDAVYMHKVEEADGEDPFAEEDPFALDCEGDKTACLEREEQLKADQASLQTEADSLKARVKDLMESNCPSQHTKYGVVNKREYRFWCGRHHNPDGYKQELPNIYTMADCADQCSRRAWCNHVLHGIYQNKCRLFESPKVSHATTPGLATNVWNCAVKK